MGVRLVYVCEICQSFCVTVIPIINNAFLVDIDCGCNAVCIKFVKPC